MEGFVIIIGLCVVAYVLAKRSNKRDTNPQPNSTNPPEVKRQIHHPPPDKQPPPFQADDAAHLDKPKVIEGRARIVDGDTIVIKKTQIRLFGIDAPEIDHPYGQKAKWALVSLCKGHIVRTEVTEMDTHGRTVGKCYLSDGRDLSAEMVKMGLAIDWPKFSGGIYRSMETADARKKLWLADARQKGRMQVWEQFENKRFREKQNKV